MADKTRQELIITARKLGIEVSPNDQVADIQQKIVEEQERRAEEENRYKEEAYMIDNDLVRVKVTPDELNKLQSENKLVGYDNKKQEAIIKSKHQVKAPAPGFELPAEPAPVNTTKAGRKVVG